MAVLKVRCPECDASIRQAIDDVDEPTEIELTCPRCSNEFTATAEPEAPPAKQEKKKPLKASKQQDDDEEDNKPRSKVSKRKNEDEDEKPRSKVSKRKDDDEEDEDEQPRKKKKKKQESGSKTTLYAAIGGGVLLLAGVVAAVLAFGGSNDKGKDTVKNDTPVPTTATTSSGKETPSNSETNPGGSSKSGKPNGATQPGNTTPSTPGTNTPSTPGTNTPSTPGTTAPSTSGTNGAGTPAGTGTPAATGTGSGPEAVPPKKGSEVGIPPIPPRPRLRLNANADKTAGRLDTEERVHQSPPLSPDEDPFSRAKTFRAEGALPPLPKLPPVKERPILALDSGGHTAFIMNVFITPDGNRVITVGADKSVRVWDIKTQTSINTFRFPAGPGSEGALQAAALSSKGRLAVSGTPITPAKGNPLNVIFIMNVETGALVKTINAASEVISLSFSNDGNRLAAGGLGVLQVFDANTGAQITRKDVPELGVIFEVRFSPENKSQVLGILTQAGLLSVVDLKNSSRNAMFDARSVKPTTIAWSNDARFIATGGRTGEIKIFDVNNKNNQPRSFPKHVNKGHDVSVAQIQYLPGDNTLLYGGQGSWAGVISADTGKLKMEFTHHSNTVMAVCCSEDGKLVATSGGSQNETFVWNPTTGKRVAKLAGVGKGIFGIGWSMDGKAIGWGSSNKSDDVNNNCPLEEIFRLDDLGPGGPAFQMKFQQAQSTDDTFTIVKHPAIDEHGAPAIVLEVQVGKTSKPYEVGIPNEKIYSVTVLPGRGKAVLGGARAVYMFDLQSREYKTLSGATGNTLSVAASPDGRYFVTGSSDQTIRIWDTGLDEPIMTIFVAGRDWIAWTPEGFYACSTKGESLLAWQINNTATKLPQVYPAARFRPSMYQPALIKYLIPAGKTQYAMAMAQKFDKALLLTSSVADIVPPEVSFDASIEENLVIDQDTVTVKANAKGGKQNINAMRLLVDGRPFKGTKGIKKFDNPAETGDAAWDVPLSPGPHTFSVIAETPISKGMSKQITITRKGEIPKPNLYVLAIGISEYPGPNKLHYAASDAKLLANAFQKNCKGVFANIEIRILMDKDASKKGIQNGLDWLATKMTSKDVGIVSFSGHGMRNDDNKFYLVTADIDQKDPFNSCLSGEEFKNRLDNMQGRLVTILDACHSGDVAERVRPPVNSDSLQQDLSSEESGVVVLSASLGREYSIESTQTKAGFFTFALAEALEYDDADINEDGVIDLSELEKYAYERSRQLSHGAQNPTTSMPSGIRPFPIAKVQK